MRQFLKSLKIGGVKSECHDPEPSDHDGYKSESWLRSLTFIHELLQKLGHETRNKSRGYSRSGSRDNVNPT